MLITNKLLLNEEILQNRQILVVDNNRDSRDLYAFLLENYGANVTKIGSIEGALNFLNGCIPSILICEMRFMGESVEPLIQQVRSLELSSGRKIPILVISTCPLTILVQQLTAKIEAYLIKPIDIDRLVDEVFNLIFASSIGYLPGIQSWNSRRLSGVDVL